MMIGGDLHGSTVGAEHLIFEDHTELKGFVHPMDLFNSPSTLADMLQNESDVIAGVW